MRNSDIFQRQMVFPRKNGFSRIKIRDFEWNFLDEKLNLLCENNFYKANDFTTEKLARVSVAIRKENFIKSDGTFLFKNLFFVKACDFKDGIAKVCLKENEWNYANPQGEFLFHQNFFYLKDFSEGLAPVCFKNGQWNYIDKNGKIAFDGIWFRNAFGFRNNFARVELKKGEWNLIDKNGKLSSSINFSKVTNFCDYCAEVRTFNNETLYLTKNGQLLKDRAQSELLDFLDSII